MIAANVTGLQGGRPAQVFDGVVVSVQGTNPGPKSGITYTVEINIPGGGTKTIANVIPSGSRPPDTIDTRAAAVGSGVLMIDTGGYWSFFIDGEFPDWGPC